MSSDSSDEFVLVHGAWHGGWVWVKTIRALAELGRVAYAPTLSGLGEREHLLSQKIDLSFHVRELVSFLEYWDLSNLVLVGHSYGGMVITGAYDQVSDRIDHLIYLDAFVPFKGEALFNLLPDKRRLLFEELIVNGGTGRTIPAERAPTSVVGDFDESAMEWINERLTDQPVNCFTEDLGEVMIDDVRKSYILCLKGAERRPFRHIADRVKGDGGWNYEELNAYHDVILQRPGEVARRFSKVHGPGR